MTPSATTKKIFNCSYLDNISIEGLFLRSRASNLQKSTSNNYVMIKKIFSYTVVQPKVSHVEYSKLEKNGFFPLEATGAEKMYEELMKLIEWSNSCKPSFQKLSDEIFEIRVKELKYILAHTSKAKLNELEEGYDVLEKYLEFIAG